MKILITGAKGQLGKKLIDVLKTSHQLILTDRDNMDITDIDTVIKVAEKEKPDFIIHAAAYTEVDKAEDEPELCRKINSFGTKNIAVVAKENNIKLIYISTDFVFDGQKNTPYNEEDTPNPVSVYGLTKYEGEKYIQEICEKYFIIRVSWLFGELPNVNKGTNFVETMLKLAKEKTSLSIVADQIGSPTYTGDLAEIIEKIITLSPEYGIYHFSGDGECSRYDFAEEIFKQKNIKIELKSIKSEEYIQKAKRPPYAYLSKTKIEKALGIKVRPWKEMTKEYFKKKHVYNP